MTELVSRVLELRITKSTVLVAIDGLGGAGKSRGKRSRWECDWMPSEDRYVAECQPQERVDLVASGTRAVEIDPRRSTKS